MKLSPTAVALTLGLAGCATAERPREGYVTVPGGRVWYAIMGDGPGTPLVVVHGGPGGGSWSLKVWEALGDGRRVVRYDQLGAGKADHPTDTTLYAVARYVQELQALRDSLGLDEIHLYGRSWGAMLVQAYMGTANPSGVRSVILSSPLVTTAQWEHDADSLLTFLPDSIEEVIARHEAARSYDALVYRYMWGPTEFASTGTLKTFDATAWLRGLRLPTLFVTGQFDEATPASTEMFSTLVPGSEFHVIPDAGHATENDNPEALLRTVRDFLRRVEGTR